MRIFETYNLSVFFFGKDLKQVFLTGGFWKKKNKKQKTKKKKKKNRYTTDAVHV